MHRFVHATPDLSYTLIPCHVCVDISDKSKAVKPEQIQYWKNKIFKTSRYSAHPVLPGLSGKMANTGLDFAMARLFVNIWNTHFQFANTHLYLNTHICIWNTHLHFKIAFELQKHICTTKTHLHFKNTFALQKHICTSKTHLLFNMYFYTLKHTFAL